MSGLRTTAVRWYRKIFGAPADADIRNEGLDTVLDGNSAVALAEASISGHAVLGGSFPSNNADPVWLDEVALGSRNLFDEAVSAQTAEGPRGIVAATTGLALAGRRATAFLAGPDLSAAQDLLISAAGKHAPLVLHVATRAASAHGSALGSSHDAVHLSADSGFFMLFAINTQEAIDFTYIARRVAEESLVPGMVIMDGEQTANAVQNVRLLSPAQVDGLLGPAQQSIDSPTAVQKLLFGETRRRVPAWHDLDEPVLTGALFPGDSYALGAFARRPYFDSFVRESLAASFEKFASLTGRRHESISRYRLDDATTVLVAQGAAVETACAAAETLRQRHKVRVGVLGLNVLRPFPGAEVAAAVQGCDRVFVLERMEAPMSGALPLMREIRADLDRDTDRRQPKYQSVVYGVGGLPLRIADLVALCNDAQTLSAAPLFLGIAFDDTSGEQPKREVLLDALRRAYPGTGRLGVRGVGGSTLQTGTLTIAIYRDNSRQSRDILGTVGALLHQLAGGRIRSRPAVSWGSESDTGVDWLTHGDDALHDPGDGLAPDLSVHVSSRRLRLDKESQVFAVPGPTGPGEIGALESESLLGGLFGVLIRARLLETKPRRVIAARERLLEGVDEVRREERMAAFRSGLEQVSEADDAEASPAASVAARRWDGDVPAAVRHLGRNDDHYASLPRFWDQLGVLYRERMSDRLTAGPYLATGTIPPLSSTFNDCSDSRSMLPVFDATLCTGCGHCWTQCPDSAIGVAAMTPEALIDAGISLTGAEAVRQVASKLALRIVASNKTRRKKGESSAPTFAPMLDDAYRWLEEKMPLSDERKEAISAGLDSIGAAIGALPIAVTEPFFHRPEAQMKGTAALLSLVVNPDACKACGLCLDACEPAALQAGETDANSLDQARALWAAWSGTPDTAGAALERAASDDDIGQMAAILLSRYCQFALAGGDPAEAGSGEKLAVRLMLAATEYRQQPLVQRFAKKLHDAGEAVHSLLTETLSGTLAIDDLDAVADKLQQARSPRVDLKDLTQDDGAEDHSVDTRYLLRLIELSKQIEAAHHRLTKGEHGLGRARYGLAVAGGSTAEWAGAFPHNPFQAPVLIDMSGDAAQLAAGLVAAHLDETTELVRLLRLAYLETEHPDGTDWKRETLEKLSWEDLGSEERQLCPPLLLIGSDEMLAGRGLGQLMSVLNSGLPIKVLVLHALDFGLASEPGKATAQAPINNPRSSLALLALAQRNAYVAQTSIADASHLGESMLQALHHDGPALLQVYAPSPTRHGFASDQTIAQAELALRSRTMPLFRYDPAVDGVFGARISLAGNAAATAALAFNDADEQPFSAADWAFGQRRFSAHFQALDDDATAPLALHEWLQLDTRNRSKQTPYLAVGQGEQRRRYSMTAAMSDMAALCAETWQTLQELAGVVTPFTERLEQQIRAEVAAEHQAQLDAQTQDANARILEMQKKTETEIAAKIRSRLMDLASKKRS